jgi:hypothetical protein
MKKLLAVLCLLISSNLLAGGKLSYKPSAGLDGKDKGFAFGLSSVEKILPGFMSDVYLGYGSADDYVNQWAKAQLGVLGQYGRVGIGLGYEGLYDFTEKDYANRAYGKISLDLW